MPKNVSICHANTLSFPFFSSSCFLQEWATGICVLWTKAGELAYPNALHEQLEHCTARVAYLIFQPSAAATGFVRWKKK